LPLIFVLPKIFGAADLEKLGKWLLILAFPMAVLVALQFQASPESILNVGAGGGANGQLDVGFGKIRPPGTFSYNTGLLAYVLLTVAYLLNTQMRKVSANIKLAVAAMPAVAIMAAVSGSRSLIASIAILFIGVILICVKQPVFFGKAIKGFVVVALALFCLSFWSQFRYGLMVHETRFSTGGGLSHGIIYRIFGDLAAPFGALGDTPFFGHGLGLGTNVAGGLITGERAFLLAEGEWERIVKESGALFGFGFIGLRLAILAYLLSVSLEALKRLNPLPALIFFAALPQVLNGQFGVTSILGFAVLTAGLVLVAAREEEQPEPLPLQSAPGSVPVARRMSRTARTIKTVKGRSPYAERLHGKPKSKAP
jgi:hypothetical protein